MKLHSVFDSDVCCFNEVITIPELLKQVRLYTKSDFLIKYMKKKNSKKQFLKMQIYIAFMSYDAATMYDKNE